MSTTRRKKVAGVTFHPAIMHYLDDLCKEEDLNRSQLITKMIRFYAEQQGTPISLHAEGPDSEEAKNEIQQETLF